MEELTPEHGSGTEHPLSRLRDRLIELGVKPERAMERTREEWAKLQAARKEESGKRAKHQDNRTSVFISQRVKPVEPVMSQEDPEAIGKNAKKHLDRNSMPNEPPAKHCFPRKIPTP